jgi:hypothetical protein
VPIIAQPSAPRREPPQVLRSRLIAPTPAPDHLGVGPDPRVRRPPPTRANAHDRGPHHHAPRTPRRGPPSAARPPRRRGTNPGRLAKRTRRPAPNEPNATPGEPRRVCGPDPASRNEPDRATKRARVPAPNEPKLPSSRPAGRCRVGGPPRPRPAPRARPGARTNPSGVAGGRSSPRRTSRIRRERGSSNLPQRNTFAHASPLARSASTLRSPRPPRCVLRSRQPGPGARTNPSRVASADRPDRSAADRPGPSRAAPLRFVPPAPGG